MKNCHFCILISRSKIIQHKTKCFITRWNTSKFITPLHVIFLTLFSVFHLGMKHCISIGAGFPLVHFDWSKIVWLFLNFLQDINKIIFHETEILCTLKWSSETMLRIAPFLCIYLFAQQCEPTYAGIFKAQRYIPPLTWQARGVCVHCTQYLLYKVNL